MPVQPIPQPHLLDPDRVLDTSRDDFTADHKQRAELLDTALHESCEYGRQLWETLANVRQYLMDALPPDPRTTNGLHRSVAAHPTGPDDEEGWRQWGAAYAAVTTTLCGPRGDNGFGVQEADEAMRTRRDSPNVRLRVEHPELQQAPAEAQPQPPSVLHPRPLATAGSSAPAAATKDPRSAVRTAGLAALGVLAVRGLLAGRGPH